jgi:hypothetical protein
MMRRVISLWERELDCHQVVMFFLLVTSAYVLPLIFADFRYSDDNWRTLGAGTAWAGQGRWFLELLYQALSFTSAAPNMFPLPLLLAVLAMTSALTRLTYHYFSEPTLACCLVPLPLWYNPFLLQGLSYQYDGVGIALSLVPVIFAVVFKSASRVRQLLVPAALLVLAFGLYQVSVNVFLGLCCVELLRSAYTCEPYSQWLKMLGWKLAQLGLAMLTYLTMTGLFMGAERTALLNWEASPFLQVSINIGRVLEKTALLFHGGYAWTITVLILFALVGLAQLGRRVLAREEQRWKTGLMTLGCFLMLPLLALLVPGITLFFRDFNGGARTLMGFGVLSTVVFYLAFLALSPIHRRLPLLLAIPLLATLSLSFAYGRVLTLQKDFGDGALYSLGHDIASRRELYEAKRIYMSVNYSGAWLISACGSFKHLPVLHYLLNVDYYMLSENLQFMGITNVTTESERRNATHVGYQRYIPIVESQYYRIFLLGDYGFIVMKEPVRDDRKTNSCRELGSIGFW